MQNRLGLNLDFGKVPTFTEVLADLEDLPALLYECVEAGAIRGRTVALEERFGDDPLDPWLVSTVLRGRIRKMLKKRGVDSTSDGPFNLSSQPLIGLLFHFKGYSFRILKAVNGRAPGTGASRPRKKFYDQVPMKYRSKDGQILTSKLNLLVLYDEDKNGASKLILACPSIGAKFSYEVAYYWIETLPYPATETTSDVMPLTSIDSDLSEIVQAISEPSRQKKKA
jgi:hypothetical protein